MEFTTQAELLEHLGKNPNDRSLVQRMIARWEVVKEWGMYVIVDKDIIIRELKEEIKELKKSEPKCVKTVVEEVIKDVKRDDIEELEERIKWLESDLEFQISENERLEAKVKRYQDSIRNSFYYINDTLHKKVDWPTYKAVIKLEWMLPWEDNQ